MISLLNWRVVKRDKYSLNHDWKVQTSHQWEKRGAQNWATSFTPKMNIIRGRAIIIVHLPFPPPSQSHTANMVPHQILLADYNPLKLISSFLSRQVPKFYDSLTLKLLHASQSLMKMVWKNYQLSLSLWNDWMQQISTFELELRLRVSQWDAHGGEG